MPPTPSKRQLQLSKSNRTVLRRAATQDLSAASKLDKLSAEFKIDARSAIKRLAEHRSKLAELNETIQLNLEEDAVGDDIERSFEYDEKLSRMVHNLQAELDAIAESAQTNATTKSEAAVSSNKRVSPKLPKLELLKFDGNPMYFQSYWDDFTSSVDGRSDITTIDKFKLLRSTLEGEALKIADGYLLTVANYEQVKEELVERYGDPELAIHAHLMELLSLPLASHDLGELQKVRDACEMHIRSLVALGMSEKTFGLVFTPIILSKLPKFVKMELFRKNGSNKWTLDNLRELLKQEIKARDKSEHVAQVAEVNNIKPRPRSNGPPTRKQTRSTGIALVTQRGAAGKNKPKGEASRKTCAFCDGRHQSWRCWTYKDVDSRRGRLKGRCFACLEEGHSIESCSNRRPCYYCNKDNHHSSLCFSKFGYRVLPEGTQSQQQSNIVTGLNASAPEFQPAKAEQAMTVNTGRTKGMAMVKSALADVSSASGTVAARIVFDDCSTESFISSSLVRRLKARPVGDERSALGWFGVSKRRGVQHWVYEVCLQLHDGSKKSLLLREMPHICPPIQLVPLSRSEYPVISELPLAQPVVSSVVDANVDILIGLDYYYQFLSPDEIRVKGVVFTRSVLGYVASGWLAGTHQPTSSVGGNSLFVQTRKLNTLDVPDVERFWRLEDLGIKDDPGSVEDDLAVKHFQSTIQRDTTTGQYQVKFPFCSESPQLSDTFPLALNRLRVLLRKHSSNPAVLEQYNASFVEQVRMNIIEEAPAEASPLVFYMPHHAVIKLSRETTKLRVVFDASAKPNKNGTSLNDSLFRGPVILANLVGLLLRFRFHRIAMASDIEKAFLMVGIQREHRDVTRFLWVRDISKPPLPSNLVIYRFQRVPFGIVSSPFMLSGTVTHHISLHGGDMKEEILDNLYVDNLFGGRDTVEAAKSYYASVKSVFADAGMNLRQWHSNCTEFIEAVSPSDQGGSANPSILGLLWDTSSDRLSCPIGKGVTGESRTKRNVLSAMSAVYDPLGWFSPVTIQAKILMQRIWKSKVKWDVPLPDPILSEWSRIQGDLQKIPEYQLSRHIDVGNGDHPQLHCFVDASKSAYAAVIYIRYVRPNGLVGVDLLAAKARVAPLKSMTVPRLELMGALIGVRLLSSVTEQLHRPTDAFLWTDSQCVIHWIRSDRLTPTFVRNRIKEIRGHSEVRFRYVKSCENPADLPTKGCSMSGLAGPFWFHGPQWLQYDASFWPRDAFSTVCLNSQVEEGPCVVERVSVVIASITPADDSLFDIGRFSSLVELLRVTALVVRVASRKPGTSLFVDAKETQTALRLWEKRIQSQHFSSSASLKRYADLSVFEDTDGLLKCRGRFGCGNLCPGEQCPVLLPPNSRFTALIIDHYHDQLLHAGLKHTLASLRSRYWIPRGRIVVKRVLRGCKLCQRLEGQPFRAPDPPDLPSFRVNPQRPFSSVGLDYMGPLFVSMPGGGSKKVWICLFTCAVIRAIHLEVAESLSAADFLLCFRRFVARYGAPGQVVSDNAAQFHAVDRTLTNAWKEVFDDPLLRSFSAQRGITWSFITELAPWMGGMYERLVSPVKRSLRKVLGRRLISSWELQTLALEISAVINTRPLAFVGADCSELDGGYLCPSDFLSRGRSDMPLASFGASGDYTQTRPASGPELVTLWRRMQVVLGEFWKSWRSDYLLNLRESHRKTLQRNVNNSVPQIGQVVLIKDDLPRAWWRVGRIKQLCLSRDGQCRTVEVLLPSRKTLRRSVRQIYPLELSVGEAESLPQRPSHLAARSSVRPPRRHASRLASERIAESLDEEASLSDGC